MLAHRTIENIILEKIFSAQGLLAQKLPHYQFREEQFVLAQHLMQHLSHTNKTESSPEQCLLGELSSRLGKTFAYLVPIILSKQQTIISTHSNRLQQQLLEQDIPQLLEILRPLLAGKIIISSVKRRQQYICLYRFKQTLLETVYDKSQIEQLKRIQVQLESSFLGECKEFDSFIEADSNIWSRVTSNKENCLAKDCPDHEQCYLIKAHQRASKANIIVVEHQVLLTSMQSIADPFEDFLPQAKHYILDEAHHLPELLTQMYSQKLSSYEINALLKDIHLYILQTEQYNHLLKQITAIKKELQLILNTMISMVYRYKQRGQWIQINAAMEAFASDIIRAMERLLQTLISTNSEVRKSQILWHCQQRSEKLLNKCQGLLQTKYDHHWAHWFECSKNALSIQLTHLSANSQFAEKIKHSQSHWIFITHNMTINSVDDVLADNILENRTDLNNKENFSYFAQQLSLTHYNILPLAYDQYKDTLFYHLKDLPLPNDDLYSRSFIEKILPIMTEFKGKILLLFSSYRALNEARDRLNLHHLPLFVQGSMAKRELLEQFKQSKQGILLSTRHFVQYYNMKDMNIAAVIIDKLPFSSPDEPILQAKIEHIKRQGNNAFYRHQLPQTALALKQLLVHLHRDKTDKKLFILGDPRISSKKYGYYLRQSLPKMLECHHIDQLK